SEDVVGVLCNIISEMLVGLGLIETKTYCLIDKETQTKKCNFNADVIELIDPVSKEHNSLKFWLMPGLLSVLKDNRHNEYPQNIFTIGEVFKKNKNNETGVEESICLCVALCNQEADFTEARQRLDYIMRMFDLKYEVKEMSHPSFIDGRAGGVYIGDKMIAYIGEVSPSVLENFGIEMPVSCFEMNLTELLNILRNKKHVKIKQK
ncbi:MAG: hypothetical protein N3D84_00885, partial [Candidatus Woesearchaeota archaeon]|nr:hypothetical protein [Candidatus Woesearchaeota archaeon]